MLTCSQTHDILTRALKENACDSLDSSPHQIKIVVTVGDEASPVAQTRGRMKLAELSTERLLMVSWTAELVETVLRAPSQLHPLLGVTISDEFPSYPVRHFVLPTTLVQVLRDPSYGLWSGMIIHKADRLAIGSMGCKTPPDGQDQVEIGYDIVPAYQGQGYATEIGRAFIKDPIVKTIFLRIFSYSTADVDGETYIPR